MLLIKENLRMAKYLQTCFVRKFCSILLMNSNRNIIFVYNAKGGKWNYILDTVHKYASPSTYECNLCKITHDLKMKEAWKKFIESSPHNFKFLHSEELEEYNLLNYKNDLPICVEENSGEYKILINKDQMNKYKDEFDLINILEKIL